MEANKQPNKITSFEIEKEKSEGFFYKEGFKEWANIPKFAVITGVNGSGKTQLLKKIYEAIQNPSVSKIKYEDEEGEKYQANEVYYKDAYDRPLLNDNEVQINQLDVEGKTKEDQIKALIQRIKINAQQNLSFVSDIAKVLRRSHGHYEVHYSNGRASVLCRKSEYATIKKVVDFITNGGVIYLVDGVGSYLVDGDGAFLVETLNEVEIIKKFVNITDDELTKYINSLVTDQSNIADMKIFNVFLQYHHDKDSLQSKAYRRIVDNQMTNYESENYINEELKKKFNTAKAPWDVVNGLLDKYEKDPLNKCKFNHRVSAPDESNRSSYNPSFYRSSPDESNGSSNNPSTPPSGIKIKFNQLSSGEQVIFHLVCSAYRGNGGVGGKTKLLLLDEFDAHLNPQMSKMFVDIVENTLVEEFGMQVIMTTHSPSTAAQVPEDKLFWMEEGKILQGQDKKEKMSIIYSLATGFAVEDNTCPFMSYLTDPTKPYYIIVEGYTDILHIKTACKKLGDEYEKLIFNKCNFINLGGTKETYAKTFLENFAFGKKTITILDNDKSGVDLHGELFRNKYKEHKATSYIKQREKDTVGILLKSENATDYQKQIKFGYLPIELMYPKKCLDAFDECNRGFLKEVADFQNVKKFYAKSDTASSVEGCFVVTKEKELKMNFAKAAKNFDKNDFEGFKPTLDLVLKVIEKWD